MGKPGESKGAPSASDTNESVACNSYIVARQAQLQSVFESTTNGLDANIIAGAGPTPTPTGNGQSVAATEGTPVPTSNTGTKKKKKSDKPPSNIKGANRYAGAPVYGMAEGQQPKWWKPKWELNGQLYTKRGGAIAPLPPVGNPP